MVCIQSTVMEGGDHVPSKKWRNVKNLVDNRARNTKVAGWVKDIETCRTRRRKVGWIVVVALVAVANRTITTVRIIRGFAFLAS
jgi:hypothetical protein